MANAGDRLRAVVGDRVGLVLAGGGARGAYEAGALSVLLPELERRGQRPTGLGGASAGALNAVGLAADADLDAERASARPVRRGGAQRGGRGGGGGRGRGARRRPPGRAVAGRSARGCVPADRATAGAGNDGALCRRGGGSARGEPAGALGPVAAARLPRSLDRLVGTASQRP